MEKQSLLVDLVTLKCADILPVIQNWKDLIRCNT